MVCYVIKHKTKSQNNSTLKGQFMDWIKNNNKSIKGFKQLKKKADLVINEQI